MTSFVRSFLVNMNLAGRARKPQARVSKHEGAPRRGREHLIDFEHREEIYLVIRDRALSVLL
jgi:hypothetical protein